MMNKIIKETLLVILFLYIFIKIISLVLPFVRENFGGGWFIIIILFITVIIYFASKHNNKNNT